MLSAAGANIAQLNTVRSQLSLVKGGGLARACRAGRLISLIISDVLGDPLELIASGPTVESPLNARRRTRRCSNRWDSWAIQSWRPSNDTCVSRPASIRRRP